ncbi:MAG: AAA family ATPase, partial [Chloroflexota bacterium]|nr:AAA family ATPase [Chloroflexota bacterium]
AQRRVTLGLPPLDAAMRGIAPGEVCEVMARAAVGKTAFVLNVLRNVSRPLRDGGLDGRTLFFTLEMPLAQVFERAAQIECDLPGWRVEDELREETEQHGRIVSRTTGAFDRVYFVDRDFLTYKDLDRYLDVAAEKLGAPVSFVVVDYLGRMQGARGDSPYEVTSTLAKQLKYLAKQRDIPILYLHQTSRAGTDGSTPVTLDMARDSGVVEEAADFVLGLWRPDMAHSQGIEQERLRVALLKARRGPTTQVDLLFRKPTLQIRAAAPGELPEPPPAPAQDPPAKPVRPRRRDSPAWRTGDD